MAPNRRLCNELVHGLCKDIPIVNTSERILLTARNMYVYLEPRFNKKLIYRDAIAYLKALLNAEENIKIAIGLVDNNIGSEPIVVTNQRRDHGGKTIFELKTNQFRVLIRNKSGPPKVTCWISGRQPGNAHLFYFLRLIALLIKPIQLNSCSSNIPINVLPHFMNTQSDWIDSIRLWDDQFDSEPIYGALSKYNKLEFCGKLSRVNVPKLIRWLTSNNNNSQSISKYLWTKWLDDGLALLIEELKKEFARATSKSRFVINLGLYDKFDEFTLCNKLTGEKLELRGTFVDSDYIYTLSRVNELDDTEDDCWILDSNLICFF